MRFNGLAILILICANAAHAVPTVWTVGSGGNGHSYEAFAVPGGITWTAARNLALAKGGDLATVTSAAENAFIYALIDDPIYWTAPTGSDVVGPWIGGIQAPGSVEPGGGWGWVTGEPFSYINWSANSPNNNTTLGNENRIDFYGQGATVAQRQPFWNDAADADTHIAAYVVEYVPEPTTGALVVALMLLASRRATR